MAMLGIPTIVVHLVEHVVVACGGGGGGKGEGIGGGGGRTARGAAATAGLVHFEVGGCV